MEPFNSAAAPPYETRDAGAPPAAGGGGDVSPLYMEHEQRLFRTTDAMLPRIESPGMWRALNPQLSVTADPFAGVRGPFAFSPEDLAGSVARVKEEGYYQTRPAVPAELCRKLSEGVKNIVAAGIHPIFLAVYDEFWQVTARLSPLLAPILGERYRVLDEIWVFFVDPANAGSGWTPHRDYTTFEGARARGGIRADGRPTVVTVWIPVTDAEPSNGCMYVLPVNLDPNLPAQPSMEMAARPGEAAPRLQDVRALPAPAGSVLTWNLFLLHWGARASRHAPHPRISIAFYFHSDDIEPVADGLCALEGELPFQERLARVGRALLRYEHELPADMAELSHTLARGARAS
jgi:Phytanoyl-CoA dioxygenase (PhyH)